METFHWDERYETGIAEVDDQHRYLVALINRLGEQLASAQQLAGAAALGAIFSELAHYAERHFSDEEELMLRSGLAPGYREEHHGLHRDFIAEVQRLYAAASGGAEGGTRILHFLMHWLAYHILGTDQAMARQIAAVQRGVSPEEALRRQWEGSDQRTTGPLLESLQALFHLVTQQNRELLELNATLEAKVAERTEALSAANRLLEHLAVTDVLTGLPNRRHALSRLGMFWAEAVARGEPLSAMMIDADGFKTINDTHGHEAGDEVLRTLARALRDGVRTDDVVCRLGGDEFIVLCPNTDLADALRVGEKLRRGVAELRVPAGAGAWHGSISVGVAEARDIPRAEALLEVADAGVYAAKRRGRNCVATVQALPAGD